MGRKPATYADLEALPANVVGELVAGELYSSPRPASRHALVSSLLGVKLGGPFHLGEGGPGGWVILDEPELRLREDVLVPDLAGWRRERMPVFPDTGAFHLAPDWACEVLSPSTAWLDRNVKLPVYAREEVHHVWLVDPEARTLEVFRLEGGRYALLGQHEPGGLVRAEPFEALELELALLWGK
ncbi:Uma2 family endonuclease [Hyalangium sp.]|uniref:Uma2 family endonuclease n=1 Tax=Hyalangium sp. TaxID=2028555 RepID=UPI002D4EBBB7|nr:Uma2 family endonuclease [Hyalangium sp.]HYI00816.1 Uma2 family endonuclease [Hyalangium sp.]